MDGPPTNLEALRRACERRYYAGNQPRTADDLLLFARAVGVFPSTALMDSAVRRRAPFGTSPQPSPTGSVPAEGGATQAIQPFDDTFAFVAACFADSARTDPAVAEDNDYFADAWEACGGGDIHTGLVPLAAVRGVFAELGFGDRHLLRRRAPRPKAQAALPDDQLTFREFTEALIAADLAPRHEVDEADDGPSPEERYRSRRMSFNIVSRVKTMVRGFRERSAVRRAQAEQDRQLRLYEARYFARGRALSPSPSLPPLVDDRDSHYDHLLSQQERHRRRAEQEARLSQKQRRLLTHPRTDGCADVVTRYAHQPVLSPLRQRLDKLRASPGGTVTPYRAPVVGHSSPMPLMRSPSRGQ